MTAVCGGLLRERVVGVLTGRGAACSVGHLRDLQPNQMVVDLSELYQILVRDGTIISSINCMIYIAKSE